MFSQSEGFKCDTHEFPTLGDHQSVRATSLPVTIFIQTLQNIGRFSFLVGKNRIRAQSTYFWMLILILDSDFL
jgi:hypothetical protein